MKILIADDDESIRRVIESILRMAGNETTTVDNGLKAWETIEASGGNFDLLITDTQMPKMGGGELVERVKTSYPKIKTIQIRGGVDPRADAFVSKPFGMSVLLEVIAAVTEKKQ